MKKKWNELYLNKGAKPEIVFRLKLLTIMCCASVGSVAANNSFNETRLTHELSVIQKKSITGTVTDQKGQPIPGVAVVLKGTKNNTVTDFDGKYSISNIEDGDILVFSYIGMKSKEIKIAGQSQLNVKLAEDVLSLEEVVVVGYGTQKKSNVTGAISSVKSEDLANLSISNAASALQGKVAGVQIVNNSGAPGSSSTVRIRGYSSNGSSDPLYIVDGLKVPNIDYLDTNNIKSIEILKDGASAAIYGAEAGNGVILVTTKKGKKGRGEILFDFQTSVSSLVRKNDLLNASEYITYLKEANPANVEKLDKYYFNDPSSYVNNKLADTDWQDAVYKTGIRKKYNVGFQGGNDDGSLYISLGYLDQDGIVVGSSDKFSRITGQFNGNYKLKSWLEVGGTNSIETTKTNTVSENSVLYGTLSAVNLMDPLTPVEYSDGLTGASALIQDAVAGGFLPIKNKSTGNYFGESSFNISNTNPLATINRDKQNYDAFKINGTVYGNLTPFKNFVFTSRLGYRFSSNNSYRFTEPGWTGPGASSNTPRLEVSQLSGQYYQLENFANYSLNLGKSTFSILGGVSYINNVVNTISAVTDGLENSADNYRYLDYSSTTANDVIKGNKKQNIQIAYFGRMGWEFDNKYNVQVNFRADSYDAAYLDLEHSWGYFPSVSAGWTVTNENFLKEINKDFLSSLKLRASYGKNGSISNLSNYMYRATLGAGPSGAVNYKYWMNDQLYTGIYPSSFLANPKLRWEETLQFNAGLDARLFNNRLSLTVDYFNKNTDGLLVQSSALLTTGANYIFQNLGIVNNHGVEVDLEWKDKIKEDFKYSIRANIATVSNNVSEYKGEGVRISGSSLAQSSTAISFFEEGYPMWYLRGYKIASIDQTNGSPIYQDTNKDGTITDADRTNIGNGIPDFTYGTTINLSYKNFDFLVYGAGAYGQELMYGISRATTDISNRPQFLFDNRWTPERPIATQAAPFYQNDPRYLNSNAFVFNGSYFKIKQIQLGYSLPKSVFNNFPISALRGYVSLDNFFAFTHYPGNDPEVRSTTASSLGIDQGGYPIAKTVMFGLNVTF